MKLFTFFLKFNLLVCFCFFVNCGIAQNIGIGTNAPNPKALLEVSSTTKGVLFPRLTTAQRNLITDVPNGLHIFNTDEHCLNYYDSVYQVWNCYCADCQVTVINITSNACKLDFYNTYAKNSPSKKYLVNIAAGVSVTGCGVGDTAIMFNNMPVDALVMINNYGTIAGAGGRGGNAAISQGCYVIYGPAASGQVGGDAISTRAGVIVQVKNYGIVAGGGGGGGGSSGTSSTSTVYGGGGGGGAGSVGGAGGNGGGFFTSSPFVGCVGAISYQAQPGIAGQATIGGNGGAGAAGGGAGGSGGLRGQAGSTGSGFLIGIGGGGGKAIGGGASNSIVNLSGGQSFGSIN